MHNHRLSISLLVIITTIAGIFAGISSLPSAHAVLPNPIVWATKASIPFATAQGAVVSGLDGRIYVIGGYSDSSSNAPISTASAYDPRYNNWTSIANEPYPTRGSAVAVGNNGLIYVINGCCSTYNNQIYNTTSNTWTTGTSIPTWTWMAGTATGKDGRIYVAGGSGGLATLQIYNPSTKAWSIGASMITGRMQFSLLAAPNGLLYAIGGMLSSYTATSAVEAYNITANTWTAKASLPAAVNEYAATLGPDGLIYIFGGSNNYYNNSPPFFNTVYSYYPPTNTWYTNNQNLPTARKEVSAATSNYNHKMYVVGGADGVSLQTNEEATVLSGNPTTTTVTCSPATVGVNNSTRCTATVTDTNSTGPITPTGNVTFTSSSTGTFTGTCSLTGTGATASCAANVTYTPTVVAPGTHTISGTYNGDTKHAFSTSTGSQSFTLTVIGRSTSTTVSCAPSSVVVNNGSTCTATLTDTATGTPSIPTGQVRFTSSGTASGSFSPTTSCNLVAGSCSVTFTPTSAGKDTVTANYQGDNVHSTSSGTSGTITSTLRTSSIGISCPATTPLNSPAACTVTVTDTSPTPALTPTGTITLTSNSTGTFTSCALSGVGASATCSTNYSPTTTGIGSHKLTAYYGGDAGHYAASSNATATVKVNVRSLLSGISCGSSAIGGVAITCTVTVTDTSPGAFITPTGVVTLTTSGSGTFGGTCALTGTTASASCTVTYTPGGTGASNDLITYTYPGDIAHTMSTGTLLVPVNPSTTTPGGTNTAPTSFPTIYWIVVAIPLAIALVGLGYFMSIKKWKKRQTFQPFSGPTTPNTPGPGPQPAATAQIAPTPQTVAGSPVAPRPQPTSNPQPTASQQPAPSSQTSTSPRPSSDSQPANGPQPATNTTPEPPKT